MGPDIFGGMRLQFPGMLSGLQDDFQNGRAFRAEAERK